VARELRRVLLSPARLAAAALTAQGAPLVRLSPEECHYLLRVLRLRNGDPFAVVDGAGHLWQACLQEQSAALAQPLARPLLSQPPPRPRLQLALAMPRRDGDVLLRMVTELGIDGVQPLQAQRSVPERWNQPRSAGIVREALEQCERLWLPQLGAPQPAADWMAWASGLRLLAIPRRDALPPLASVLAAQAAAAPGELWVAIGPEGGWTDTEQEQALALGWQPVSLGQEILRTSTAAVAAVVLLSSWRAVLAGGSGSALDQT